MKPSMISALLSLSALATAMPAVKVERQSSGGSPPRNVIYVQTFTNSDGSAISLTDLVNQQTGVTHVNLAALHINNGDPTGITLNDQNPNSTYWDNVWSEVATLQQAGIKVLFMIGGAAQGSYTTLCSGSNGNVINFDYYTPLKQTIAYHNIQGVDLDIEEDVDISCPLALLQQLDADFGSDFLLTMAPVASGLMPSGDSLSGFSYSSLDQQATSSSRINGKLVTWYNCQFYSGFGDPSSPNDYESIVNNGFDPSRVVLGVLDNGSDGSGFVALQTVQSTIASLKSTYSNFGDVFGWEYFNAGGSDNLQYPWQWVQAIGQSIGTVSSKLKLRTTVETKRSHLPWPEHTETLVNEYGVRLTQAAVALNRTRGSLEDARVYLETRR